MIPLALFRRQRRHVSGTLRIFFFWAQTVYSFFLRLQIELKAEDLYDKEKVDLETIVIEDVFKLLQCDENGLSTEESTRRLEIFGPNKLESEEQNPFLQVCSICPLIILPVRS